MLNPLGIETSVERIEGQSNQINQELCLALGLFNQVFRADRPMRSLYVEKNMPPADPQL